MAVDIARVYLEAEDRSNSAFTSFQNNLDGVISKVGAARTALTGAFTVVAAAGGLTAVITEAVKARAALDDLHEETGLSVEMLSRIRPVAEIAGKSIGDVTDAVIKFNKKIQEARDNPGGGAGDLFRTLRVDVSKAKSGDDILAQTIKRFDEYRESAGKSAAAQDAFGKSGAKVLPIFKDLAEAGERQTKVTKEQAAEAENLEKNIRAIMVSMRQSREELGGQFIPAVSAVTAALRQMREESDRSGDKFRTLIGIPLSQWAGYGAITFAALVDVMRATWNSAVLIASGIGAVGISVKGFSEMVGAGALIVAGRWEEGLAWINKANASFADSGRFMKDAFKEFQLDTNTSFTKQVVEQLQAAEYRMIGFNTKVGDGKRDWDGYSKAAQASLSAILGLMEKANALVRVQNDERLKDQQDLVQRELAYEEFLYAMKLHGEEEYINRKAELQRRDAELSLERARNTVASEEQLLSLTRQQQKGVESDPKSTANDQLEVKKKILEHEARLASARGAVTKATRDLADVERTRDRDLSLMGVRQLQYLEQVQRETEDYIDRLKDQSAEMRFQVSLMGESELAQKKLTAERRIWLELREKEKQILREIQDLQDKGGSGIDIGAKNQQLVIIRERARQAAQEVGQILEDEAGKQWSTTLARGIADALVDGGKDAGPRLRKAIEDAFKSPIRVALNTAANNGLTALFGYAQQLLGASQTFPQFLATDPNVGMYGFAAGAFGGAAARWSGAGDRGQALAGQYAAVGAMAGAYAGAEVGSVGGPWGAVIGAVVGLLAGIFSDPAGNAQRTARFGTNPSGAYGGYRARDAFGTFGTWDEKWFSDSDMGQQFGQFLTALTQTENRFASFLSPEEIARARAAMSSSSREYGFGEEHGDFGATLSAITRDRMSTMVEAIMPGFGHLIAAAEGTAEDFVNLAQAILGLRDAGKSIKQAIAEITGDSVAMITASLDTMNTRVSRAQSTLDQAFTDKDTVKIFQSEQELTQAVLERYRAEINMVRQLEQAIRQLEQEAYQFQLDIAQRINSVGGSRDIGGIAMGRASVLRGRIGGSAPTSNQIEDLQGYVGAIDTWYNARRSAIERDIQAQAEAQQALSRAAAAAAQARVQQLQDELALANGFKDVLDRAKAMIEDLKYSASNPLSLTGRLAMSGEDVDRLRDQYLNSSGYQRIDLANQLMAALERRKGLGEEAYQRPSPEWEAIYNQLMTDLNMVSTDAKSAADLSVDLERQILEVQRQAAAYQASAAASAQTANGQLDALNEEALGYYTWAETEGQRLYELQRQLNLDQLNAITGGMEVQLFIADRQRAAVAILERLDARIAQWLSETPAPMPTTGTGTPTPGGGRPGVGTTTQDKSTGNTYVINAPPNVSTDAVIAAVKSAAPVIRELVR